MALLNCKQCGGLVSDQAIACPHCGYPVNGAQNRKAHRKQPKAKHTGLAILVVAAAVSLLVIAVLWFSIHKFNAENSSGFSFSMIKTEPTGTKPLPSSGVTATTVPAATPNTSPEERKYTAAKNMFENGDYEGAIEAFSALGDYSDSKARVQESYYKLGERCEEQGDYIGSCDLYYEAGDFSNAKQKIQQLRHKYIKALCSFYTDGGYDPISGVFIAGTFDSYQYNESSSTVYLNMSFPMPTLYLGTDQFWEIFSSGSTNDTYLSLAKSIPTLCKNRGITGVNAVLTLWASSTQKLAIYYSDGHYEYCR